MLLKKNYLSIDQDSQAIPMLAKNLQPYLRGLLVCLSHSWGGLEKVAVQDALDLKALGLNVQVLCLENTPVAHSLIHQQVPVQTLNFQPRNYFDWRVRQVLKRLIHSGINLIHTHQTSLLGTLVPWLWAEPHVAVFATRHIMNDHSKKDFFHRTLYRRLDAFMVMSKALYQNVLNTHAIPQSHLKIVPLGLDFDRFNPRRVNGRQQRERWGIQKNDLVVGMVGRIDPAKGQATLIQSAANLVYPLNAEIKSEQIRLKFVIVGEETLGRPSNYLNELKAMVSQFHLEKEVIFSGYHDNIPEIMKAIDIFVMPSQREAFGLVAIEAMAMERPVILSKGGSSEEIVGQEEYGLTVRPNDAFDLQRQIRYLLDHPAERVKMGKKARKHVQTTYDWRNRVYQTLLLYQQTLRERHVL